MAIADTVGGAIATGRKSAIGSSVVPLTNQNIQCKRGVVKTELQVSLSVRRIATSNCSWSCWARAAFHQTVAACSSAEYCIEPHETSDDPSRQAIARQARHYSMGRG
jgi:hypothetical protein